MQCQSTKSNGKPCKAQAVNESEFCFSHDPALREAKLEAVTNGGKARRQYLSINHPIEIKTIEDIKQLLAETIQGVWAGTISARQPANTLGFLARCYLDVYEKIEVEGRIIAIEKKLEELTRHK
ncbi:MAG: hypothetical protein AAB612_02505 [Patescibacteria group bacterium]